MATEYYGLRAPFTAIRVIHGVAIVEVAGERPCAIPDLPSELLTFADRGTVLATRGDSGTVYIDPHRQHLADELQLISEYGDLTTLGEVRRGVAP